MTYCIQQSLFTQNLYNPQLAEANENQSYLIFQKIAKLLMLAMVYRLLPAAYWCMGLVVLYQLQ